MREMWQQGYLIYAMGALLGLGTVSRIILAILYSRLIRDTGSKGKQRTSLTKRMKMKYETACKNKIEIPNVEAYVNKFIYQYRFTGITLRGWQNIGTASMLLCALVGVGAAFLGYWWRMDPRMSIRQLTVGVGAAIVLFMVDGLMDIRYKERILRTNFVDFLENSLRSKLQKGEQRPEKRGETGAVQRAEPGAEFQAAAGLEEMEEAEGEKSREKKLGKKKKYVPTEEEKEAFREVLQQFLS